jgi:hypothetical protein
MVSGLMDGENGGEVSGGLHEAGKGKAFIARIYHGERTRKGERMCLGLRGIVAVAPQLSPKHIRSFFLMLFLW